MDEVKEVQSIPGNPGDIALPSQKIDYFKAKYDHLSKELEHDRLTCKTCDPNKPRVGYPVIQIVKKQKYDQDQDDEPTTEEQEEADK